MKSPFSLQGSGVHVTAERPSVHPLEANSFRSPGFQRTVPTQWRSGRSVLRLCICKFRAKGHRQSRALQGQLPQKTTGTSSQHMGKQVPDKLLTVPRGGPHTRASPRSPGLAPGGSSVGATSDGLYRVTAQRPDTFHGKKQL